MRIFTPLLLLACCLTASAQLTNLGKITITRYLGWDADTNATFKIYGSLTNETNFTLIATSATNRWGGTNASSLSGWRKVYVTALTDDGGDSLPSQMVLLEFRAGKPAAPTNMQIFTFVNALATNDLQVVTEPLSAPIPP